MTKIGASSLDLSLKGSFTQNWYLTYILHTALWMEVQLPRMSELLYLIERFFFLTVQQEIQKKTWEAVVDILSKNMIADLSPIWPDCNHQWVEFFHSVNLKKGNVGSKMTPELTFTKCCAVNGQTINCKRTIPSCAVFDKRKPSHRRKCWQTRNVTLLFLRCWGTFHRPFVLLPCSS